MHTTKMSTANIKMLSNIAQLRRNIAKKMLILSKYKHAHHDMHEAANHHLQQHQQLQQTKQPYDIDAMQQPITSPLYTPSPFEEMTYSELPADPRTPTVTMLPTDYTAQGSFESFKRPIYKRSSLKPQQAAAPLTFVEEEYMQDTSKAFRDSIMADSTGYSTLRTIASSIPDDEYDGSEVGLQFVGPGAPITLGKYKVEIGGGYLTIVDETRAEKYQLPNRYSVTEGLFNLLLRKDPQPGTYTSCDIENYGKIAFLTELFSLTRSSRSYRDIAKYKLIEKYIRGMRAAGASQTGRGAAGAAVFQKFGKAMNKNSIFNCTPNELVKRLVFLHNAKHAGHTNTSIDIEIIEKQLRQLGIIV